MVVTVAAVALVMLMLMLVMPGAHGPGRHLSQAAADVDRTAPGLTSRA